MSGVAENDCPNCSFDCERQRFLKSLLAFLNDPLIPAHIKVEEVRGTQQAVLALLMLTEVGNGG